MRRVLGVSLCSVIIGLPISTAIAAQLVGLLGMTGEAKIYAVALLSPLLWSGLYLWALWRTLPLKR